MGISLVILNADFKKNAVLPAWLRIVVKAGTSVTLPIKTPNNVTRFTITADATNETEDKEFEFQLPSNFPISQGVNANNLFNPNVNASANNILAVYMDMSTAAGGDYMFLENTSIQKIVLFGNSDNLTLSSAVQSCSSSEYIDCSQLVQPNNAIHILYPINCSAKEIDMSLTNPFSFANGIGNCVNNCQELEVLRINNWRLPSASVSKTGAFGGCAKLRKIYIDDADTASYIISIIASKPTAKVDSTLTTYDSTNGVINVVHSL
jgi:hypothetical protein